MKKLYLVDVSSMFFRAFYAIRQLNNSKGLPTNAVYGFLSMMVKLLKETKPDYIAFCFDLPDPSFRKNLYAEYKANRSEMPEELAPQIPYIKRLSAALGVPMFEKPGYEADDIIGTLTKLGRKFDLEVSIVSGDKDFSQLVEDHVHIVDTMKNLRFDPAAVVEKWGVKPENFIDYQALTGDSSDNIPGVRGVGPKGAQKLIEQFGSIEKLYENLEEVKNPGLKKKLEESKEMAFLSKQLVTIETNMDLKVGLDDLKQKDIHREDLGTLLDELEFQTFKKNLLGESPESTATTAEAAAPQESPSVDQYQFHQFDFSQFEKWLKGKTELWILDRERHYLFAHGAEVVQYEGDEQSLSALLDPLKDLAWKGYDLKSTWRQMGFLKPHIADWDSLLAAYVVRAGPIESFQVVHETYLQKNLPEIPHPTHWYQAHLEVQEILQKKLQETNMLEILRTIELPVIDVLAAMETKGVLIDADFLAKESKDLAKDIQAVEKQIHEQAGESFNVASPKQLAHILFEKMQIPAGKKTKTGYSTNTDVLEKLEADYPISRMVVQFREYSKLKSTYVDALPTLIDSKTGRVHTQFNQALTVTGRLSSVHPNLQNIPIRTERGQRIRRAFIAAPGHVLVSADYSQIELRILAHISKDKGLSEAFAEDMDIHTKAASEIFEVPADQVTEDLRRKAKAVNFGIAYGQGPHGLAESLRIPRSEAKDIIERYFQRFPGVKEYMESAVEFVKKHGYTETILGRRRYIPEINSKNFNIKAFAERAAINAPIQGMSSDLVKLAMIEVAAQYRDCLILQVHDELMFELPEDEKLSSHLKNIKAIMENCMSLDVPLKVNVHSGADWSQI